MLPLSPIHLVFLEISNCFSHLVLCNHPPQTWCLEKLLFVISHSVDWLTSSTVSLFGPYALGCISWRVGRSKMALLACLAGVLAVIWRASVLLRCLIFQRHRPDFFGTGQSQDSKTETEVLRHVKTMSQKSRNDMSAAFC